MRKILLSLTVLAGVAAATSGSQAASFAGPVARPEIASPVQTVQYYGDRERGGWRRPEWRRREHYENWRRHEHWRRWHHRRDW